MKYSECRSEQAFKMEWIRRNRKYYMAVFCIETEETVKGFPDVLAIDEKDDCVQTPYFLEFKKARNGFVEFQPTQPAFYRKNPRMFISMVALVENKGKQYIVILPAVIVLAKLKEGLRLDLRPFCTEQTEVKERVMFEFYITEEEFEEMEQAERDKHDEKVRELEKED